MARTYEFERQDVPSVPYHPWLLEPAPHVMVFALYEGIEDHGRGGGMVQARKVYDALHPFANNELTSSPKQVPPRLSAEVYRFFTVSAGMGVWEQLGTHHPHLADLLLQYYVDDKPMAELQELMGEATPGGVDFWLDQGLTVLWHGLPEPSADFPLDKRIVFPPVTVEVYVAEDLARRARENATEDLRHAPEFRPRPRPRMNFLRPPRR